MVNCNTCVNHTCMKVLRYSETKKNNLDADIPVYHVYCELLIWMPNNALVIHWQGIEKIDRCIESVYELFFILLLIQIRKPFACT